jgi:DNA-binding PadR family transcriptional regulator
MLTPAMFHILLALAEGERHGYAIMQQVAQRTGGALELGPGTLYRSIKLLLAEGLIAEVKSRSSGEVQRRFYRLTTVGHRRAATEAERLRDLVSWAESADVLQSGTT